MDAMFHMCYVYLLCIWTAGRGASGEDFGICRFTGNMPFQKVLGKEVNNG